MHPAEYRFALMWRVLHLLGRAEQCVVEHSVREAGHYRQVAAGIVTLLERLHYKCMCQLIAYAFCAFHCM